VLKISGFIILIILFLFIIYFMGEYTFETSLVLSVLTVLIVTGYLLRKTFLSFLSRWRKKRDLQREKSKMIRLEKERIEKSIEDRTAIYKENLILLLNGKANLLLLKETSGKKFLQFRLLEGEKNRIELCITKHSLNEKEEASLNSLDISWEQTSDSYTCCFGDEINETSRLIESIFIDVFGCRQDYIINFDIVF